MLQLGVKAAFLNGTVTEELYLYRPEGFIVKGKEHLVYRLFKALYDLKKAPRAWHVAIDLLLNELGFYNSTTDRRLYVMIGDRNRTFIQVYVDEIILFGREMLWLKDISILISNKFEVRTEESFNISGNHRRSGQGLRKVKIHNSAMVDHILRTFNLTTCRDVSTPLPKGRILDVRMGRNERC